MSVLWIDNALEKPGISIKWFELHTVADLKFSIVIIFHICQIFCSIIIWSR